METKTIIRIVVDRNIHSIRKNLTKHITGYGFINKDEQVIPIEVADTTISAFTQPYDGSKMATRIYSNDGYLEFADVIEIEMEGEGTKEIVVDFVKRVQDYFAKSKSRTNYRVLDYGLEVHQIIKKQNYTDFTGSLL